jgi:antitoxin (DNA-binding transcriptional repressor) of toxin-antitoxin stability system
MDAMATVNVYEAKSSLSRLIAAAEAGETIVIARNGKPVAQLGPVPQHAPRVPGRMKGKVRISADFDEWTADDEAAWYGNGSDPLAC